MSPHEEIIHSYLSKKLQISLSGKTDNLHVINWKTIVKKHEELMEAIEDMDDEEAGEYLVDHESELMQITENFMNDACDEKVEDDKWLPFGLVGLPHEPKSLSALTHHGLLLLDMTKNKAGNPPVILFKKGKVIPIADSLSDLEIKEIS